MKYMLLLYSTDPKVWDALPQEQRDSLDADHMACERRLAESGQLIASEALAHPSTARTVRVRNGVLAATDGPFAESKEWMTGFYLVDCESLERAIELAATVPDARFNAVEVRPVMELAGVEM